MKDTRIIHKVVNDLHKNGYSVNSSIISDIQQTVARDTIYNKRRTDYILGLVCDFGFFIGMTGDTK